MRTKTTTASILVAAALIGSSCGARVSPYLPSATAGNQNAASVASPVGTPNGDQSSATATTVPGGAVTGRSGGNETSGGTAPGGSGRQTSSNPASVSAGSDAGSGGQPNVQGQPLSVSNFSYNPQSQASYCTGTTGNTASAPGVTPTSITVGNVSGITGAVADSFQGPLQATQALFDAVNRYGGICGRKLVIDSEDDQQNSSNNASDVSYLIPKVLAFVGSLSDGDNGGVNAMVAVKIPDIGPVINTNRSNAPTFWSATGGSVTVRNGRALIDNGWLVGLQEYHQMPKSIAILSYDIPISAQAGQEFGTAFQRLGVKICYSNYSIPPAPGTVMGSVVSSMQQKGCDGVFTTMDVVGNADMLQDMQADGFHPSLISTTYEGYNSDQISLAGNSAAQGLDVDLNSLPLGSPNPGIQLYQYLMQTYEPGQVTSEFGVEGWASAEMFLYALLKAGRNPTRASLTSALAAISDWNSDGAFGPYTPGQRTGDACSVNIKYEGNNWSQTWPQSGFYCKGSFVDVGPAS
ncbi:MAG TPA: ABC transporter substrate-binding protein [Acidimicrobiales bacterium]|jgi:ABC-type branched-subunit amino acid transport system substrate-binding protein|nr:ABC transporter substrate-binding protein [Acidimicrobiales bacterium]